MATSRRFVRPPEDLQPPPVALVERELLRGGLDPSVAGAAAELVVMLRDAVEPPRFDEDSLERTARELAEQLRGPDGGPPRPDVAFVEIMWRLWDDAGQWGLDRNVRAALVECMVGLVAGHTGDLSDAVAEIYRRRGKEATWLLHSRIVSTLLDRGLLDPRRFVEPATVRATSKYAPGGGSWDQHARERDPALPDYWAKAHPQRAMVAFADMLRREPRESLGALALGFERALDLRYPSQSGAVRALLVPLAAILCERRREEGLEHDRVLTGCCWSYERWANDAVPEVLASERGRLRELALAELGRMRGWLRGTDPEGAQRLGDNTDYLDRAITYVLRTESSSLWDVLRRMLLALRELAHLGVRLDLKSWERGGDGEPLPRPWAWVPERIGGLLEVNLGPELERDPGLAKLRENLARFCLDRLKTSSPKRDAAAPIANEELVEPDPMWRRGYLHALEELHVNPGGRGHNVLAWTMRHDPDENVRAEAKIAHQALRRADGRLPPGMSPRRAIHAVFWWLKQAHVLALGFEPDQEGAQRTFRKEMRRARELDEKGW